MTNKLIVIKQKDTSFTLVFMDLLRCAGVPDDYSEPYRFMFALQPPNEKSYGGCITVYRQ